MKERRDIRNISAIRPPCTGRPLQNVALNACNTLTEETVNGRTIDVKIGNVDVLAVTTNVWESMSCSKRSS
ncbi:hypothetical protein IE4872_PD02177 (plasmid) [Rhizobium gallicum]|uniref:Uncharacterized protein n=1 Tax=Rhizobium gallicum TaxID=56730 RepID=A0A1L5NXU3_9HYPH|nr:hypothetical protein IE4872_PD02177 [Rhizobium gallicum]